MRSSGKVWMASALVAVLAVFAGGMYSSALAHQGRGGGPMLGRLLRGIDLTAQQRQQVKGILQGHHDDLSADATAVAQARQNLMAAETATAFDENAVRTAYAAFSSAQANMAVLRAKIFSEVMGILTPDQQTAVRDKLAKAGQRMQRAAAKRQAGFDSWLQNNQ